MAIASLPLRERNDEILRLFDGGMPRRRIAALLRLGTATVKRALAEARGRKPVAKLTAEDKRQLRRDLNFGAYRGDAEAEAWILANVAGGRVAC